MLDACAEEDVFVRFSLVWGGWRGAVGAGVLMGICVMYVFLFRKDGMGGEGGRVLRVSTDDGKLMERGKRSCDRV